MVEKTLVEQFSEAYKFAKNVKSVGSSTVNKVAFLLDLYDHITDHMGSEGLGYSISTVDYVKDGKIDLVIGAPDKGTSELPNGAAVLSLSPATVSSLTSDNFLTHKGKHGQADLGFSVASGDINKDSRVDLIVGSPKAGSGILDTNPNGRAYILFNDQDPTRINEKNIDLSIIKDLNALNKHFNLGTYGIVIKGECGDDLFGYSVANIGDVNGDGYQDIGVGAPTAGMVKYVFGFATCTLQKDVAPNGRTYVIFGGSKGKLDINSGNEVEVEGYIDGSKGFEVRGDDAFDRAGTAVASAGDFNGDGIDDFMIGAPGADNDKGQVQVIFGRKTFKETLKSGDSNVLTINGFREDGGLGHALAPIGRFNSDAYDDIAISAPFASNGAGEVYILFGKSSFGSSVNLDSLSSSDGLKISELNTKAFGFSMSFAGDLDGDGRNDLLVGAPQTGSGKGRVYSYFGRDISSGVCEKFYWDGPGTSKSGEDSFGFALAGSGHMNPDSYIDFAVGDPWAKGTSVSDKGKNVGKVHKISVAKTLHESVDEDNTLQVDVFKQLESKLSVDFAETNLYLKSATNSDSSLASTTVSGSTIYYKPLLHKNGQDTICYSLGWSSVNNDFWGTKEEFPVQGRITVKVNPVNDAPVAKSISKTLSEGGSVIINKSDLYTDIDSNSVSVRAGSASHGSIRDNGTTLTYTPENDDFNGSDSFSFTASDGDKSASASVTLKITPVNDAPVAKSISKILKTSHEIVIQYSDLGSDVDSEDLDYIFSKPSKGEIIKKQNSIVFKSNGQTGTESLGFTVSDGSKSSSATLELIVKDNIAPVPIEHGSKFWLNEDSQLEINKDALAQDEDDSNLIFDVKQPNNGVVQESASEIIYKPKNDFNGEDKIIFSVSDGIETIDSWISMNVIPINDAPVTNSTSKTLSEDTIITIYKSDLYTDIDSDNVTITAGSASHGLVKGNGTTLTYIPEDDFNGNDYFSFTASDGEYSKSGVINLEVTPVNDLPVAKGGRFEVKQGKLLFFPPLVIDPDSGERFEHIITVEPKHGRVNFSQLKGGPNTYRSDEDYYGNDFFSYLVKDRAGDASNNASITLDIAPLELPSFLQRSPELKIDLKDRNGEVEVDFSEMLNTGGDEYDIDILSQPENGHFVHVGGHVFTFSPDQGSSEIQPRGEFSVRIYNVNGDEFIQDVEISASMGENDNESDNTDRGLFEKFNIFNPDPSTGEIVILSLGGVVLLSMAFGLYRCHKWCKGSDDTISYSDEGEFGFGIGVERVETGETGTDYSML